MFNRPDKTYNFDPKIISNILLDPANPLNRISEIIPDDAKVLDIGAGNGLLACVLREKHKNIIIDGIEPNHFAAGLASKNYRHFYQGFAQDFIDIIHREDYDFVVLADVLEHVNDPLALLLDLSSGLSNKTRIIISVPNIAFGAIRIGLMNGEFNYVDSGILEKTHVRFFTLKTIEMLVSNINMKIEKLYFLQRNFLNMEINLERFNLDLFCLYNLLKDDLASVYQFLLVLTKEQVAPEKKFIGEKAKYPLLRYILLKSGIRKLIGKIKNR